MAQTVRPARKRIPASQVKTYQPRRWYVDIDSAERAIVEHPRAYLHLNPRLRDDQAWAVVEVEPALPT